MKHLFPMIIATLIAQSCTLNRWAAMPERDGSIGHDAVGVENQSDDESDDSSETVAPTNDGGDDGLRAIDGGGRIGDASISKAKDSGASNAASNKRDAGSVVKGKDSGVVQPEQPEVIVRPPTSAGEAYGDWTYYEVEGAICRDGSPAGYYLRKGASKNLLIFLNGGGVCYDSFFCTLNPANVDESLPGETLFEATIDTLQTSIAPERQIPPDEGIFEKDPRNPVADWSMVYVPYCTGDIHSGTKRDATLVTSPQMAPQQFVGYSNIGLFYRSFGPDFLDSEKVLLTGSSAGGFGALLNYQRTQAFFKKSQLITVTDSAVPFRDDFQDPCIQKIWRQLWGLDEIIPKECRECFGAEGGGLAEVSAYNVAHRKVKNKAFGGVISSKQDEVMKLFYSAGLDECTMNTSTAAVLAFTGRSPYPYDRFPEGLQDFIENVIGIDNGGSYIVDGSTHQHLFRQRFYEDNGVDMTLADWLASIIAGSATHVGDLL
jgi:hypothetical protein